MKLRNIIKEYFKALTIGLLITFGWQGLELLMIGKIIPSDVDSVVAIVLTLSIYFNLKMWGKIKSQL